jgi:hypothetical protein
VCACVGGGVKGHVFVRIVRQERVTMWEDVRAGGRCAPPTTRASGCNRLHNVHHAHTNPCATLVQPPKQARTKARKPNASAQAAGLAALGLLASYFCPLGR